MPPLSNSIAIGIAILPSPITPIFLIVISSDPVSALGKSNGDPDTTFHDGPFADVVSARAGKHEGIAVGEHFRLVERHRAQDREPVADLRAVSGREGT